ncbi:hypothetical protein CARN8_2290002 [mine drainage metagenome]|uniref:Uncharacterized protein n=1 Tax=mine drainage metagenome TaxID=410659 RepID=A0A3P3ZMZ1_9ZZZZ
MSSKVRGRHLRARTWEGTGVFTSEPVGHAQLQEIDAGVGVLYAGIGQVLKAHHDVPVMLGAQGDSGTDVIAKLKVGAHVVTLIDVVLTEVMCADPALQEGNAIARGVGGRVAKHGGDAIVVDFMIAARGGMGRPVPHAGIPIAAQRPRPVAEPTLAPGAGKGNPFHFRMVTVTGFQRDGISNGHGGNRVSPGRGGGLGGRVLGGHCGKRYDHREACRDQRKQAARKETRHRKTRRQGKKMG